MRETASLISPAEMAEIHIHNKTLHAPSYAFSVDMSNDQVLKLRARCPLYVNPVLHKDKFNITKHANHLFSAKLPLALPGINGLLTKMFLIMNAQIVSIVCSNIPAALAMQQINSLPKKSFCLSNSVRMLFKVMSTVVRQLAQMKAAEKWTAGMKTTDSPVWKVTLELGGPIEKADTGP